MPNIIIEYISPDLLRSYSRNAKNHPEKQIAQIAASIKEFGFNNPILVDESGEVIAGHGRLAAAKVVGLDTVPVIRLAHLSEAQKRAYRLADNKIAENGGWNTDLLRLEISELETICGDLDISITGFDSIELDVMFNTGDMKSADPKANTVPYVPENEIMTRPGDIWLLGAHRIICENSLEPKTFERLFGDKVADMVLQDPPYNVKISGHVCGAGTVKHKEFAMASGEMKYDEFTEFLRKNFDLCAKFSRPGSLHYNFMDWRHIGEITAAGAAFSDLVNMCVWVKSSGGMGSLYRSQHELCFIFKNGAAGHVNNIELGRHGRYRTNVWNYAGVNSFGRHKGDIKLHPTVKPVEMLKDAILDVTRRGDIVLDSFLGSGSNVIAAHQAKRVCYGIELEPLYVDTAIRRFKEMFGIDAIHEASGKTYGELLKEKGVGHE